MSVFKVLKKTLKKSCKKFGRIKTSTYLCTRFKRKAFREKPRTKERDINKVIFRIYLKDIKRVL